MWNGKIDADMRRLRFVQTASDACEYVKGSGDSYMLLMLYVNGLLMTELNKNIVDKVRTTVMTKFTMADFGDTTQILGIDVIQDKEHGTINISQDPYVRLLLEKSAMANCNPVHTPSISNELTTEFEGSVPLDKQNSLN